jgi:hypothetical protein
LAIQMKKSAHDVTKRPLQIKAGVNWINKRLQSIADESRIGIQNSSWQINETEMSFVLTVSGRYGKRAMKMFNQQQLEDCRYNAELQSELESELRKFLSFFRGRRW